MVGFRKGCLGHQLLSFLQGKDLVNEGETARVGHGCSHTWRQLQGRLSERAKAVHHAEGTATKNSAFSALKGFGYEDGYAIFNGQCFNACGCENRFNRATCGHTDISPTRPTDGDRTAGCGGRQSSHFSIQDRVGGGVIGLTTVPKPSCDAGEATGEIRRLSSRGMNGRHQGSPPVNLHAHHPVKDVVGFVSDEFRVFQPRTVNKTCYRTTKGSPETCERFTVHHINRVIGRMIACFGDGVKGEVDVPASGKSLPCLVPLDHGDLPGFAGIDETFSQSVLFVGQLLFGPVNPRGRGLDQC